MYEMMDINTAERPTSKVISPMLGKLLVIPIGTLEAANRHGSTTVQQLLISGSLVRTTPGATATDTAERFG
jgi:hypothetical protein